VSKFNFLDIGLDKTMSRPSPQNFYCLFEIFLVPDGLTLNCEFVILTQQLTKIGFLTIHTTKMTSKGQSICKKMDLFAPYHHDDENHIDWLTSGTVYSHIFGQKMLKPLKKSNKDNDQRP
jgi:hypothetical protein